jgi:hypothetical protein
MTASIRRPETLVLLAGFVAAGCAHHVSSGGPPSPRDQKAIELLVVTGTLATQQLSVDQLVTELEQSGEYSSEFTARLRELAATGDLRSKLFPVYERHLDERTIDAAVAFFGSPSGGEYRATEATVSRDLLQAANDWLATISACASQDASAPAPKEKTSPSHGDAMAREVLDLTGGQAIGPKVLEEALQQIDKTEGLPPGYRDRFEHCAHQDEFQDHAVSVFAKDVGEPTLQAALAFYGSDAGRTFTAAQPALFKAVPKATAKYAADLIRRADKETRH